MGKVLKRLQLQFFLILWIVYSGVKAAPYSSKFFCYFTFLCKKIHCLECMDGTKFKSLIGETSILFTLNLILSDKRVMTLETINQSLHTHRRRQAVLDEPFLKILSILFLFIYLEYGRTCRDIGCLPREVCVMSYDTCSFNQQEGTNCGRYPTCTKADKIQQPPSQSAGKRRHFRH